MPECQAWIRQSKSVYFRMERYSTAAAARNPFKRCWTSPKPSDSHWWQTRTSSPHVHCADGAAGECSWNEQNEIYLRCTCGFRLTYACFNLGRFDWREMKRQMQESFESSQPCVTKKCNLCITNFCYTQLLKILFYWRVRWPQAINVCSPDALMVFFSCRFFRLLNKELFWWLVNSVTTSCSSDSEKMESPHTCIIFTCEAVSFYVNSPGSVWCPLIGLCYERRHESWL